MDMLDKFILTLNDYLYSYVIIAIILVVGIFFTIRGRGMQFTLFPEMFRVLTDKATIEGKGKKGVSSFQAFTISAASRIGTGNIVGVATAIALGGPGAVFWMWVMALIAAASSFVESTLAQLYKVRDGNDFRGGPAYYMERGLNKRWMGIAFAIAITLCYGFVFNAVQTNTIADSMGNSFGFDEVWIGIIIVLLTAMVIFGGVQRIVKVTQWLVPVMAIAYILIAFVIIVLNFTELPSVFALIFKEAFTFEAGTGGVVGAAIMQGFKRGLFSNEAGLGSAPNAAATANVSHPVKQGLIQTLGVFVDTMVVCTATAAIVLLSGVYGTVDAQNERVDITQQSLVVQLGDWAGIFLTVALFMFAFSSVIGNYYYGETNLEFIKKSKTMMLCYRLLVLAFVMFGALAKVSLVWNLADLFMAFMALINLVAIFMLNKTAFRLLKDYRAQRKQGKDPVFYADTMPDLKNVECWDREDHPEKAR
ncbi:alanine/glycine:cation symporter family protein [Kurthia huakuii]|uniref:alanine/glycine:cation symporter family protein n=1 Tax=Kurthia huakuii TaxID=1421019 RepID=UPI000497C2DA|nr:alanine/glycine:cation symporter family protein [Kurthia huakuii]MBM7698120.1 AGCS family alanine or glycine:cation symporter [Kurthia huakuii]